MKSLFALIVGINDYQHPYKKLKGCVKDANNIKEYINTSLKDQFSLKVESLIDKNATYINVMERFEKHLSKAGPDDVVWFHFSGHGSQAWSAPEFHISDASKKDQTMLCYASLPNESYNLADKELAVLIYKVANFYPNGNKKENPPHILISLDCCHSGSGTRVLRSSSYNGIRSANTVARERVLSSYANGYYTAINLAIPFAPHINISACRRHEIAGDSTNGGAFSTGLVKALKASKNDITYADLYLRTRAEVRKIRRFQNPKFSFLAEMNPYTYFLSQKKSKHAAEYEVYFQGGRWYIKYGIIHGLIKAPHKKINVELLTANKKKKKIGAAQIIDIGTLRSTLEMDLKFSIKSMFSTLFGATRIYIGAIRSLPVKKEFVLISGNDNEVNQYINNWSSFENIELTQTENGIKNIELKVEGEIKTLKNDVGDKVFASQDQDEIATAILQMTRWHRFLELDNTDPLSIIAEGLSFELFLHNPTRISVEHFGNTQVVNASFKQHKNEKLGISPKIFIKDGSRNYFFYLFYMDKDYSITCHEEETIFRGDFDGDGVTDMDEKTGTKITDHLKADDYNKAEVTFTHLDFQNEKGLELDLWKDVKGIAPAERERTSISYLKLIVTSQELDYFQFIQGGIGTKRSDSNPKDSAKLPDDWATFKIELRVKYDS
ncbi:MAG: caspase family protein [Saprospiraceae bacterium]